MGKALGAVCGQVAFGPLVDVDRNQIHRRLVVAAIPAVAFEKAVDNVLAVRVLAVFGNDGSDLGTLGHMGASLE